MYTVILESLGVTSRETFNTFEEAIEFADSWAKVVGIVNVFDAMGRLIATFENGRIVS